MRVLHCFLLFSVCLTCITCKNKVNSKFILTRKLIILGLGRAVENNEEKLKRVKTESLPTFSFLDKNRQTNKQNPGNRQIDSWLAPIFLPASPTQFLPSFSVSSMCQLHHFPGSLAPTHLHSGCSAFGMTPWLLLGGRWKVFPLSADA